VRYTTPKTDHPLWALAEVLRKTRGLCIKAHALADHRARPDR
jgi:hypothetical protein